MKKWLILILLLFLGIFTINLASALNICENRINIGQNCTMLTPTINCAIYNYTIYNKTLTILQENNLTNNNDKYYFNFSMPAGDYLVQLCDGSTREIRVTFGDDNMIISIIMIIPFLFAILLIWLGSIMDVEHIGLKFLFYALSFPNMFVSLWFSIISLNTFYSAGELGQALGNYTFWLSLIFVFIILYFLVYVIWMLRKAHTIWKAKKKEY
jgi:ABC-type multidrug transport system fused ATPase/permease subunit